MASKGMRWSVVTGVGGVTLLIELTAAKIGNGHGFVLAGKAER